MKTKTFLYLALVGLSLCAVLYWYCISYLLPPKVVPLKTADVRQTLQRCGSETEIQAEVDSLFIRYGDKEWKSLYDADLSTTPGLARLGKALSHNSFLDPRLDIEPSERREIVVPSHVEIRFGQHFHYQSILIFRTGSDLSSMKSPYERVTSNVYFKP